MAATAAWVRAGSSFRWVVVLASLWTFLFGQLVVGQVVDQPTPDILVVKQIDAEEAKLKDEGNSHNDLVVVPDDFSFGSFNEQLLECEGKSGFLFERLLCLGSRGPPKG